MNREVTSWMHTLWFVIFVLFQQGYVLLTLIFITAYFLVQMYETLVQNNEADEHDEIHLGRHRLVPQQCTDQDQGIQYFETYMWQERGRQLEEIHSRLETARNSPPDRPRRRGEFQRLHRQNMYPCVEIATQTTQEETGTEVDTPPNEAVMDEVISNSVGITDIHRGQPAGNAEVHDAHIAANALPRTEDSGYGSPGQPPTHEQDGIHDEDQNIGEAGLIPGASQTSMRPESPQDPVDSETTYDPDSRTRQLANQPSQMEEPD